MTDTAPPENCLGNHGQRVALSDADVESRHTTCPTCGRRIGVRRTWAVLIDGKPTAMIPTHLPTATATAAPVPEAIAPALEAAAPELSAPAAAAVVEAAPAPQAYDFFAKANNARVALAAAEARARDEYGQDWPEETCEEIGRLRAAHRLADLGR